MAFVVQQNDNCRQGRDLFVQQDYEGALKEFNMVLSKTDNFALTAFERLVVLDHRAATHIKLGNLSSALEDGRSMIKTKKNDPQGYLRTGQVCELLERYQMALGVYKYGLENVSSSEPNYKVLGLRHERMLRNGNLVDPVRVLPGEIVEMIMKHLTFTEFAQILRVSMFWYTTLCNLNGLWTNLNLTPTAKHVPLSSLRHYMRRSRNALARARIFVSKGHTEEMLNYILSNSKSLKHLDITFLASISSPKLLKSVPAFDGLKVLLVSANVDLHFDIVKQLLRICKNLTRAEFNGVYGLTEEMEWREDMPEMRSLAIKFDQGHTGNKSNLNLPQLFKRIPQIQHLGFARGSFDKTSIDYTMLSSLQSLELISSDVWSFPQLPPSIRVLNLSHCVMDTDQTRSINTTEYRLPHLTSLQVAFCHHLKISGLKSFLSANKGNLTVLNLQFCNKLTQLDFLTLISEGFFNAITDLNLEGCAIKDELAPVLAAASPGLIYVDISSTKVTGVGVKALVQKSGCKLQTLKMNSCLAICKDAADFARDSGIEVEFKFPDHQKCSKRRRQI